MFDNLAGKFRWSARVARAAPIAVALHAAALAMASAAPLIAVATIQGKAEPPPRERHKAPPPPPSKLIKPVLEAPPVDEQRESPALGPLEPGVLRQRPAPIVLRQRPAASDPAANDPAANDPAASDPEANLRAE